MQILKNLFGKSTPIPEVREGLITHPPTKTIHHYARKGDWQKVRDMFAAESDAGIRNSFVRAISNLPDAEKWIVTWFDAEPRNADAWLLAGANSIQRGAAIRGTASADETPEERWDPFHEMMMNAEEELLRSHDLRPSDPLPFQYLLVPAMALGAPTEERMVMFEEGRKRAPEYSGVCLAAMTAVTEKWGGSHELMFNLARGAAAAAPPNTAIPAVLAMAHAERWLYYAAFENDNARAASYFKSPAVRREIAECWQRCGNVPEVEAIWVANTFSFCFYKGGDLKAAKRDLQKANGAFSDRSRSDSGPWQFVGIEGYRRALRECWNA